ncbi:MAG: DUF72 domain-containing protein [Planctomycetes bacterium]|nr:DUF72 domain-containing protein [Planctomycetota bacterium]
MPEVRVGPCGFCLRHQDLFRTFAVLEIQQTFYQPPRLATVQRWRQEAGDQFEFTLKAFQAITHEGSSPTYRRCKLSPGERAECGSFRDTPVVRFAWETTLALARALEATFMIFQCPASFRPTAANLANLRWFFKWAERGRLLFGWEPRGRAWTAALVTDLCRELNLIHVVDPFQNRSCHGSPRYYRLHGIGGYEYRYSDQELQRLKELCTEPLTYCMFNNTAMAEDAQRFRKLLASAGG